MITDEQAKDKTWCLSRAGADVLLGYVERAAADIFASEGKTAPIALLWAFYDLDARSRSDRMEMIPVCIENVFVNEMGKDAAAQAIRDIARQVDAFAVAFISEARLVTITSIDEVPPQGSYKNVPGHREVVMIHFEHAALGRMAGVTATADIVRQIPGDEDSPGTLQAWLRRTSDNAQARGRFADLLPGARCN